MTIQEKVSQLLSIRAQIDEAKKAIEPLQAQRDEIQKNIIETMQRNGFNSVKTDEATVSKMISKKLNIVDEKTLIGDLKSKGLNDYVVETVDKELWRRAASEAIKQGATFAGTELSETEYISIRKIKNGKEENDND